MQPAAVQVQVHGHGHETVAAQLPPLVEHDRSQVADRAVHVEVHAADGAGVSQTVVGQLDPVAVAAQQHPLVGHTHVAGKPGVGHQMLVLAVHRHEPLRRGG